MTSQLKTKVINHAQDIVFNNIHDKQLIYNACWEDPRIDRTLLQLNEQSRVVMITSAGCNTLDYLLDSPGEINSIDTNPRQNALLHLKMALIRHSDFEDLFAMFGRGVHYIYEEIYTCIRSQLPAYAKQFWDDKITYFSTTNLKKSFYYHGTAGHLAWLLKQYLLHTRRKIRTQLFALLEADGLEQQQALYAHIEPRLWNTLSCWLVNHPFTMAMIGVPSAQVQLINELYQDGLVGFIRDKLRHVATQVLMMENYFWRVYLTGSYSRTCCPNYLKEENLPLLQENVSRVKIYTCTISRFLKNYPAAYSHYVLLDHQDWLARHNPQALAEEWYLILKNSRPGTKILMRSASITIDFLPGFVQEAIRFFPEITRPLHKMDRVGTYGSLYLAEVI